jgi:hypothetical protein
MDLAESLGVGAGLVLIAALVPHLNTLDGGFHYDDEHALERNIHLRQLSSIPGFFLDSGTFSAEPDMAMYRPLLQTTFALNYALTGYDTRSWHLVNVLLHGLAAMGPSRSSVICCRRQRHSCPVCYSRCIRSIPRPSII